MMKTLLTAAITLGLFVTFPQDTKA